MLKKSTPLILKAIIAFILPLLTSTHHHFKRVHNIIELDKNNYLKAFRQIKRSIVFFHDSTCHTSHCEHALYTFREAANAAIKQDLSEVKRMVHFMTADMADINSKKLRLLTRKNYPSVFFIGKKFHVKYHHSLEDSQRLHMWIDNHVTRQLKEVDVPDDVDNLISKKRIIVVFKGMTYSHKLYIWLSALAPEFPEIPFLHAHCENWDPKLSEYGNSEEKILMFKNNNQETILFEGNTFDDLKDWIVSKSFKPFQKLSQLHLSFVRKEETPLLLYVDHTEDNFKTQIKFMKVISEQTPHPVMTATLAVKDFDHFRDIGPLLNTRSASFPALVLIEQVGEGLHFIWMDQEMASFYPKQEVPITYQSILKFLGHHFSLKLHHTKKPEVSYDKGREIVKHLVSSNFHRLINYSDHRDALIFVHNGIDTDLEALKIFKGIAIEQLHKPLPKLTLAFFNQKANHQRLQRNKQPHLAFISRGRSHKAVYLDLVEPVSYSSLSRNIISLFQKAQKEYLASPSSTSAVVSAFSELSNDL